MNDEDKIVFRDDENDEWTISYIGVGGPIISHKDLDEAHRIYDEAFRLSEAVMKLHHYNTTGMWANW